MLAELQDLLTYKLSVRRRYEGLYRILVAALNEKTRGLTIEFSGTFARLDYLCRETQYKEKNRTAYRQLCGMRARCTHLKEYSDAQLEDAIDADTRALCEWLSELYQAEVPDDLKYLLALNYPEAESNSKHVLADSMRCIVLEWDEKRVNLIDQNGQEWQMAWQSSIGETVMRSFEYLQVMLQSGSQINLIRPWTEGDVIHAEYIIYEPDLLIDTSSIAACFQPSGATAWHYLTHLLETTPKSSAQLLGNLAGQMLDEEVYDIDGDTPRTYGESLSQFFTDNAVQVVTCSEFLIPDLQKRFHEQARAQQLNIRRLVHKTFAEDRTIQLQKVVLEPTFYCESLGLQGRMDLLQSDKHVLMEQKSGKMDEYHHTHVLSHYVQILLYQAMLHYAYQDEQGRKLNNDDIGCYLLYSRYPEGLLKETPASAMIEAALKVRNQIAYIQLLLSRGEVKQIIEHLTPETFNVANIHGRLWDEFMRPRLQETLDTIQHATPLEKDYFYRMFTFVAREHILSKIGTSQKEASGFAALWNCTLAEKREAGDLLDGLSIADIDDNKEIITLSLNSNNDNILPNFRTGDIVVLYAYPAVLDPDVRRDMVFRASIIELTSEKLRLRLRAPQKNVALFHPEGEYYWAVEHDFMESSYNGIYRALYMFLQATPDRRNLLLGQREPSYDDTITLSGDYGKFNNLVSRCKQAKDYFLLVGPPGTGKTSCGLVNILKETLLDSTQSNVLLVSYTNRAVDEICGKLVVLGIPFIRMGSELHCPEDYQPYLLSKRCKQYKTAQEIRLLIQTTRVIVGTTTSMSSNIAIFDMKRFDLCIIDEASQILEPQLLALLCAKQDNENAIGKFVMIGDHKQLPAVVQQKEEESVVKEEDLHSIGLYDCRQSLFERLLRLNAKNERFVFALNAQGRMHHDVAEFPNQSFYEGLLQVIPLKHQLRDIPYHTQQSDIWMQLLSQKRISFVDIVKQKNETDFGSDKVNVQEAMVIAQIVYAAWKIYEENDLAFSSADSVGVIVPYRHQISTIKKQLEIFNIPELLQISIDTVERYQGSQRDIIIYGFTVSKQYQIDFLTNNRFVENGHLIDRKLNVAMTRAREIQIMIGNANLLKNDPVFADLLATVPIINPFSYS